MYLKFYYSQGYGHLCDSERQDEQDYQNEDTLQKQDVGLRKAKGPFP